MRDQVRKSPNIVIEKKKVHNRNLPTRDQTSLERQSPGHHESELRDKTPGIKANIY